MRRKIESNEQNGVYLAVGFIGMAVVPFWILGLAYAAKQLVDFPAGWSRPWMWPATFILATLAGVLFCYALVTEEDVS